MPFPKSVNYAILPYAIITCPAAHCVKASEDTQILSAAARKR